MNRYAQTIFCDDIRHELGGKLSFIGVYSGRMFVPSFPTTLPKLCVVLGIVTPADRPFRTMTIRILRDEEMLVDTVLDEEQLTQTIAMTTTPAEDERRDKVQMISSHFIFSPLQITQPGRLEVQVETEEGQLQALGISIEEAPNPRIAMKD